jgi:uncharacterized repeat protein (TIGR03803 family)
MTNATQHPTFILHSVRGKIVALVLVCALTFIRPSGAQTFQTLFTFGLGPTPQGATGPDAQLVLDSQGNIYGTTVLGGLYNRGTVYELPAHGSIKVIHNINPERMALPR